MQVSQRGAAFIAAHEGVVTRAYRDAGHVWTIGVGHTAAAGPPRPLAGMAITRAEAFDILARDLPKYERRVATALPGISQAAFDGAVSFDFNTGAIDRASWVNALRSGDTVAARRMLMGWTKAGGRTVAGLARRREAEARQIFAGDYGDIAKPAPAIDEVRAWQADLAALRFYTGAIDGIAGPETEAAVLAYQQSHPDLVADGTVGPATRASLARDVAARKRLGEAVGAAIGGALTSGGAAAAAGAGHPLLFATVVGLALLLAAGGFVVMRYRSELMRALLQPQGS
jgi:lysozyme